MLTIETLRLHIATSDEDSALILGRLLADPVVHEPYFVGRAPYGDDTREWGRYCLSSDSDRFGRAKVSLAVRLRSDDAVIGCVQLAAGQLSYFLNPACWRQGYGQEMVSACCQVLPRALGLDQLQACVVRENQASRRILERAGFTFKALDKHSLSGLKGHVALLRYTLSTQ